MNRWLVAGGALGVGAVALYALAPDQPKGEVLPPAPQPTWSSILRMKIGVRFNLKPPPGKQQPTAPQGVIAHWAELKRKWGTIPGVGASSAPIGPGGGQLGGHTHEEPKLTMDGIAIAALEWANLISSSGALVTDGGRKWVEQTAPGYVWIARSAGSVVSLEAISKFHRELADLAAYLDKSDDQMPANPDNRTYWDFLWKEAQESTPLKVAMWPVYGPYYVASKAWDAAPDVAVTALREVLGPAAKFIVTTFGVVIFVGGVGYFVYRRWPK